MNRFYFGKVKSSNRRDFTRLNVEKLKGVLSYFSYLHKNGEISDKAFEFLVRHACAIFIENEVEVVVKDALEEKLMTFLFSKFAGSTEDIESSIYSLDISRMMRSR